MTVDWWTLALQTVNFLVLVWILARFFFRPVRQIIAQRQQASGKSLAEAEAMRDAAAETLADAKRARALIDGDRNRLLAAAEAEAGHQRERLLAEAKQEADKIVNEARAAAEQQRVVAEQGLIDRVRDLSIEIARRLLARLPPAGALGMFVQALCDQIAGLEPETRAAFIAADGAAEVVTASPLSSEEQDQVRGALEAAFGAPLNLSFRTDPAVIAGLELNAPHAFVRSSWREDLERIRKDLSSGAEPAR